jgi:hypothetical protein
MAITYMLVKNHLTSNPTDYMARVAPTSVVDFEALVERMMSGGSTVTRADIYSVLESYYTSVETMVLEGKNINTPLGNFRTAIKGVFDGADDNFDNERHQIVAVVDPGKRLRKAINSKARVMKEEKVITRPNPLDYYDLNSGNQRNRFLTPDGLGKLLGYHLQFDLSDENQGIFFLREDGFFTRVVIVGENHPKKLLFSVPDLVAGEYTLEVRAIFGKNDLRTGRLDASLIVD